MKMCRFPQAALGAFVMLVSSILSVWQADAAVMPGDVKLVEYIQSNGSQWIDTGFAPSNKNIRIEVTYQFVDLPPEGSRKYIFGSSTTVGGTNVRFQYAVGSPGNCFIGFGNTHKGDVTFDSYDTERVHTIVCSNGVFSLDGATSDDWDLSSATLNQNGRSVYLFGHNVDNPAQYRSSIKMYSCRIWNYDELVLDFLPAVTNNIAGLYDKVNGKFLVGSGGFTAGADVPMYKSLAYIESDQSAYINTRFTPTSKTEIEMKFSFSRLLEDKKTYVFGEYGDNGGRFQFSYGPSDLGCFLGFGNSYTNSLKGIPYDKSVHIVKYVRGEGFYFDGSYLDPSPFNLTKWGGTSCDLFLGGLYKNKAWPLDATTFSPIRIYYCKIWEDGVLVRDFVPRQRKFDGENGLYDLANGVFHFFNGTPYNGKTTDFTAGELAGMIIIVR